MCLTFLYRAWALYRHILLNKYDCHIAYLSHTINILNGYIDPTFLQICATKQWTAIPTPHVIVKYVLEINVPTKLGLYAKYLTDLFGRCIHIYVPNMKSMQSTMRQWALYTYLTYITEQIWLPHCKYMFKCTSTVVHL